MKETRGSVKSDSGYAAASALSNHIDTRTAATEVASSLAESLAGARADLVFLFGSFHHRAGLAAAGEIISAGLSAGYVLGLTAESVIGNDVEFEGRAGLSAIALSMPGATLHPFRIQPGETVLRADDRDSLRKLIGWRDDTRAVILLADPFSTPMAQILPMIDSCGGGRPIPIGGGLASGASQPGQNTLVLDDESTAHGLVGVTIGGEVDVDFVVSQGCRPVGKPLVVTKADQNVILELGGRPALEVIQEVAVELPEDERELLTKGLLIGVVIDEYKERFGRGDFLVRNVIGVDQERKAIAVGDYVRTGRTIQLHARDAETATEDLHLLLDAQQLKAEPFGCLLVSCNGRGSRLFGEANHDVGIIRERLNNPPLAGFFAAGEIGPVGTGSFLHGHTASLALFRRRTG